MYIVTKYGEISQYDIISDKWSLLYQDNELNFLNKLMYKSLIVWMDNNNTLCYGCCGYYDRIYFAKLDLRENGKKSQRMTDIFNLVRQTHKKKNIFWPHSAYF